MTTAAHHHTLWGKPGKNPIKVGWCWIVIVWEKETGASRAPPGVSRIETCTHTRTLLMHMWVAAVDHRCFPTRSLQWWPHKEVLPHRRHVDKAWPKWTHPAVSVLRKRPRGGEVWNTQNRSRWDRQSIRSPDVHCYWHTHTCADSCPNCFSSSWYLNRRNLPHRLWSHLLRWSALDQKPGQQTDALYLFGPWRQLSGFGWVGQEKSNGLSEEIIIQCIFSLCPPPLSVQRLGARCMAETLMDSPARSPSFTWGRPTTPAPQMDAQMGSCGALQPQTMRQTSSTLFALKRMVSLRGGRIEASERERQTSAWSFYCLMSPSLLNNCWKTLIRQKCGLTTRISQNWL